MEIKDNIKKFTRAALTGLMVLGLAAIILFVPTTAELSQLALIPGIIGAGIFGYSITNIFKNARALNEQNNDKKVKSETKIEATSKPIIEVQTLPAKSVQKDNENIIEK